MTQKHAQQTLIGFTLFCLFVLVVYGLMGSDGTITPPESTSKPLMARTSRDNAQPITSDNREMDELVVQGQQPAAGSSAYNPQTTHSALHSVNPDIGSPMPEVSEETQAAIREALNGPSPQTGIDRLREHLEQVKSEAEGSQVHSALGALHLQTDPPNVNAAFTAFESATDTAPTGAQRERAALREVHTLVKNGQTERAMNRLETILKKDEPVSTAGLQLRVMLAGIHETNGDTRLAENTYADVLKRVEAEGETFGQDVWSVYRQACLKLTRIYKDSNRTIRATQLTNQMERTLTVR